MNEQATEHEATRLAPRVGHTGGPLDPVLYNFDEVRAALRMGKNQVYAAFKAGQIPGGTRIGRRWYAIRAQFDRKFPRPRRAA